MSAQEDGEPAAAEVHAIGISFGNSNSSIAYTSGVSPAWQYIRFWHKLITVSFIGGESRGHSK